MVQLLENEDMMVKKDRIIDFDRFFLEPNHRIEEEFFINTL